MLSEIISLLGGIAITLAGAVAKALLPNLIDSISLRNTNIKKLKGQWQAIWYATENDREEKYIEDRVEIKKIKGYNIIGVGEDVKGSYKLKGKFALAGLITLTYEYDNKSNFLVGVLILRVDAMMNKCEGYWHGYTKENKISGGRVEWLKL